MSQHWIAVAESAFPWEMAALRYLRERLPEQEPFRAWANFEFVADDGSINEVDLLVVSLYKVYLVEIKSRPGRVWGDTSTWTWTPKAIPLPMIIHSYSPTAKQETESVAAAPKGPARAAPALR